MSDFSHLGTSGEVVMVDITSKRQTERQARARGEIEFSHETLRALEEGELVKGNKGSIFTAAKLAAIQSAKLTSSLIPLCHDLNLSHVDVFFAINRDKPSIEVTSLVKCRQATGVEMEALTSVTVALLTLYDMLKAKDKKMKIQGIMVTSKQGGNNDFSL